MAILSQFKEQFQQWPQVPCKNSVVELTATLVTVSHTWREEPMLFGRLCRNQPDWQKQLRQMLAAMLWHAVTTRTVTVVALGRD